MIHKLAYKNTFFMPMDRFFRRTRQQILGILFASFIFTFVHSAFHNDFDHHHDAHCAVYVLEQFYYGVDIIDVEPFYVVFLPFVFDTLVKVFYHFKSHAFFSIRAPPSCSSL
ncbi:MAG: hypothetical protein IE887_08345 [Campylobacterales bacterium]|nr:hypothetical protein [Campylobacterales bacterium]